MTTDDTVTKETGMTKAIDLIAAEQARQIAKGYTPEHDAEHAKDELARAAACYAMPVRGAWLQHAWGAPEAWPWERQAWKPTPDDRVRELVKAGALIAAEIDRLLAASESDD